ncbi:MAG: oligosaccharide flippase family protein, partial [Candidatus Methanomethylicaceae archaeon]
GTVIGNVLFPVWLFQGMEKMVFISVINLVMRVLVVAGIFVLVRQPEDYLVYAGLMSLGSIGAGVAGAGVALSKFKLSFVMPSLQGIWEVLKEGWMLFLSMASVSLYTVGNAFILGLLTNHTVVGYYSAAEKIVKAISGLFGPISQAAYPRFSKMAAESKALALQWGRRMLFSMGGLGLILSLVVFVEAPLITKIVLGPDYGPSVTVIQILASLCFLIAMSNVLGVQIMFSFHYERAVFVRVLLAGLLNISIALLVVPVWSANGMALAVLVSETFVTVSYFAFLRKKGLIV